MKKTVVLFLCLLAGGLVWCLWPEYGSGYSEEQRRLWNERQKIYPVTWDADMVFPCRDSVRLSVDDIAALTGTESVDQIELMLKQKRNWMRELDRRLIENRERSGGVYDVAEPLRVDTDRLPLEGLTEQEIAERALAGDGDACLKMVQYLHDRKSGYVDYLGVVGLSWSEKRAVEEWLDRAIAVKRPGAQFLKNYLQRRAKIQKQPEAAEKPKDIPYNLKEISGYADYRECLKKGDYLLFQTLDAMLLTSWYYFSGRDELSGDAQLIHDVLLQEARMGKVEAQRNLASLCFESNVWSREYFFRSRVIREMQEKVFQWKNWFSFMPDSWNGNLIQWMFSCGVIDADRTPTMKRYDEAVQYAYKAARQGDLTGMYLWMRYGISFEDHFSARQWQEIFSYNRLLFEGGYAPYVRNVEQSDGDNFADEAILSSFYSEKSYSSIRQKDYTVFRDRVDSWPHAEIIRKNDLEETRRRVGILCLVGRTDLLLENLTGYEFGSGGLLDGAFEEVSAYLVEQVKKWADEGDLLAIYTLAGLYEKGIGVPADPGKADALYRKAFVGTKEQPARVYAGVSGVDSDGKNMLVYTYAPMKVFIPVRRALVISENPNLDFPAKNSKEVYEQLQEASQDTQFGYRCYSAMGLFHEHGVGLPVDRKKAMELYEQGHLQNDTSQAEVKALSEILKSVES